jgi:1,4-alpha-glucan branching enzyme
LFIKALLKGLSHSPYTKPVTAWEQYSRINPLEVIKLPEGSWGVGNSHEVWSNDDNKWTWEAIYNDELRLSKIYAQYDISALAPLPRRIITQALRELMLLHSSDWQFLIYTRSAQDYAEQRFIYHHSDFNKMCDLFEKYSLSNEIELNDELYLKETEERNSIFPELNPEWWAEPFS